RKREPAFGPRFTTRRAEPSGNPSTPEGDASAWAPDSISFRRSARNTDVVSTDASGLPEFWLIVRSSLERIWLTTTQYYPASDGESPRLFSQVHNYRNICAAEPIKEPPPLESGLSMTIEVQGADGLWRPRPSRSTPSLVNSASAKVSSALFTARAAKSPNAAMDMRWNSSMGDSRAM